MAKRGEKIPYQFDPYRREVVKALPLTKLSGADFRVLLFILGQTDGYHRTQDNIKPAFFTERTRMDKGNVRRTIARLRKWNMISKNGHVYEVLPPDKWDKDAFIEPEKRFNSEAELPPSPNKKRFNLEAPSASDLKRSEVKIEAVLASSKEHYTKEHLLKKKAPPTTHELKILDILKGLEGWRYDEPDDLAWLRELTEEFSDFNLSQLRLCRDHYSERAPPKHKGIWEKRLRNWMIKKQEFEKGGKSSAQSRAHQRGAKEPSAERYRQSLER